MTDTERTPGAPVPSAPPPSGRRRPAAPGEPPGPARNSRLRVALLLAGTVLFAVWASWSVLLLVLALVVVIFLHELGHYLTAKWAGMKVTEFFIGFGPRLWSFRRGETEYGLKAIPAGAYVRIIGMSNLEEVPPEEEHRTYRQKPYWRRMSVALAGSTMHFLIALVLIFVLFVGFGVPRFDSDRWVVGAISELETGPSPARDAGIELGDRIVAIDGQRFASFAELTEYVRARPGEEVEILVDRDGQRLTLSTTLASRHPSGDRIGFLGIGPEYELVRRNPLAGARDAVVETGRTTWLSVRALGAFFTPGNLGDYFSRALSPPSEPVPIEEEGGRLISVVGAVQLASSQEAGLRGALYFLFAINIFIGIFNLIPLLPLDGGHVAIATYEKIRSRGGRRHHADVARLLPLTYAVVAALVLVGVTAIYLDITQPFQLP